MLFDVLMHEVGHHVIQQYKGKRPARVARTKDHEALAERFAARCRELYATAWEGEGAA
jgi:Zn-dependent peptidase ImmA (M78 family)